MASAEIVSGNGKIFFRQHVDLGDSDDFGKMLLRIPVDLAGKTWVRIEAWDIASNGAFTQPMWIGPKVEPDFSAETSGLPVPNEKLTAGFADIIPTAAKQPAD